MAYNLNPPQAKYTATAGQTVFNYLFKTFFESDLVVYQVPEGSDPEIAVPLILNIDYTVVINGDDGGYIILTSGATLNDAITIYRRLKIDRYVEYQQSGDLLASTLNNDQDYQTYLIADLEDAVVEYLSGESPGSSSEYVRKTGDVMTGSLQTPTLISDTIENTTGTETHNVDTMGIESGSNVNGSYIKYPDGTLICTNSLSSGTLDGGNYRFNITFPLAFISSPTLVAVGNGNNVSPNTTVRYVTSTTAIAYNSGTIDMGLDYQAIGRWK